MLSLLLVSLLALFYKLRVKLKYQILLLLSVCALALAGLYVLKKDSADGRLLIWRCTYEMVKDKPQGFGEGGFKANYMNYQAKYFEKHPDSKYAMLADNVNRPFNEYLLVLVDYGIFGLLLLTVFAFSYWHSYHVNKQKTVIQHLAGWCLCGIAVFALFSYPLHYPLVWVMGIASCITIRYRKNPNQSISKFAYWFKLATLLPIVLALSWLLSRSMYAEMKWCRIAHKSLQGQTEQMLPEYGVLYPKLQNNEAFLYNYAAELNVVQQYEKSLEIARECERLWADYDLQMLMADNYQNMQQNQEAESHYIKASQMCPVKFMPLYRLFQLYENCGEDKKTQVMAGKILKKPVKVMSPTIKNIQQEIQKKINDL
ncbi:hypothetical protein AGMMS49982_15460 [Bacteroidia bacterium]|nr:hypothetical protein AGMMS49982_15460 [Bacteroidia bacterium]